MDSTTSVFMTKKLVSSEDLALKLSIVEEENRALKRTNIKDSKQQFRILEAFKSLYPEGIKPPVIAKPSLSLGKGRECIAVLHLSDTQIGKRTASYNSAVAEDRIANILFAECIQTISMYRTSSTVKELRLYLGGDIVEGEELFPTQQHEIDSSVFSQAVKTAPQILFKLITKLLNVFEVVKVSAVVGNHGRNSQRASEKTNWDRVCYEVTRALLLGNGDSKEAIALKKRLSFDISPDFYIVDKVFDWGNLIVHGHELQGGYSAFPWSSVVKTMAGWVDAIDEPWDNVFIGHLHTPTMITHNHRTVLFNGTTESHNNYAKSRLAAVGYPTQQLIIFEEERGIIGHHLLRLTKRPDRVPQRSRIKDVVRYML